VWLICRVVRISDIWGQALGLWCPGIGSVFPATETVSRQPYEWGVVDMEERPLTATPQNARVVFGTRPDGATIYYIYLADGETVPEPGSNRWSVAAPGTIYTLARHATDTKYIYAYASYQGINGRVRQFAILADTTASIGQLVATQATGIVTFTAVSLTEAVRSIRWFRKEGSLPTVGGTTTGALDSAKMTKEAWALADGGGLYFDGTPASGGVTDNGAVTSGGGPSVHATGTTVYAIAVPIDANGNPGARVFCTVTVTGGSSPTVSGSVTLNSAGVYATSTRSYDFAFTVTGAVDLTDDLELYATINGTRVIVTTVTNPASVAAATGIHVVGLYPKTGSPDLTMSFDAVLKRSGVEIAATTFTPTPYETLQGEYLA
jgi:hypothetical protein